MQTPEELVAYVGRRLFERRLTDMSGGNISLREGGQIYISPRFSGSKKHWQLVPEDILKGPIDTDELLADPMCSRETRVHLAIYRSFPDASGIVHAHPFHVLPFCAADRPIEMILESTRKFGTVDVIRAAPAHSPDLAANVVEGLRGKEQNIRAQAAAVLAPKHGIFVAGKTLMAAIDATERIDWNAWCILARSLIPAESIPYVFDRNA